MSDTANLPTNTKIWPTSKYYAIHKESLRDSTKLWTELSRNLIWKKNWAQLLDWKPPFAKWYVHGELNASENSVDRHMSTWRRNKVAYYWEGEPGDRKA